MGIWEFPMVIWELFQMNTSKKNLNIEKYLIQDFVAILMSDFWFIFVVPYTVHAPAG